MNGFPVLKIAVAALLPIVAACGDDEPADPATATSFTATLSGANEVPAVTTTATRDRDLCGKRRASSPTPSMRRISRTPYSATSILRPAGVERSRAAEPVWHGRPRAGLHQRHGGGGHRYQRGDRRPPAITFDELLSAMRSGGAYVNVHTNAAGCTPGNAGCNAGGEIRGQIVPQ